MTRPNFPVRVLLRGCLALCARSLLGGCTCMRSGPPLDTTSLTPACWFRFKESASTTTPELPAAPFQQALVSKRASRCLRVPDDRVHVLGPEPRLAGQG